MSEPNIVPASDQNSRFIRNQIWCECERSCNVSTGQLEEGLSVYDCRRVSDGIWEPTGPAFDVRATKFKGQERKHLDGLHRWYLVSGHVVGAGSEGEPLIKGVKVYATLKWDGSQYFQEDARCDVVNHGNHPNHPNCTCNNVDDYLNAMEGIEEGDEDVEMGDPDQALRKYKRNPAAGE